MRATLDIVHCVKNTRHTLCAVLDRIQNIHSVNEIYTTQWEEGNENGTKLSKQPNSFHFATHFIRSFYHQILFRRKLVWYLFFWFDPTKKKKISTKVNKSSETSWRNSMLIWCEQQKWFLFFFVSANPREQEVNHQQRKNGVHLTNVTGHKNGTNRQLENQNFRMKQILPRQ